MKLRIQGNSLRLRLNQKEVGVVRDGGHVESSIAFAPDCSLSYLLERSPAAESTSATFDGRAIRVTIPMQQLTEWVESDQVGIEAQSQFGVGLLIEKTSSAFTGPSNRSPTPSLVRLCPDAARFVQSANSELTGTSRTPRRAQQQRHH
jgi:hypothetical protein